MKPRTLVHVDMFCGAGGASLGVHRAARARGLKVKTIAINHWTLAVETHSANFPDAIHYCQKVESVSPIEAVPGGVVHFLTAGPECIFFSRARGGRPKNDQSRASAWHIVHWCEALHVEYLTVENVPDFINWGPLNKNGDPIKKEQGKTFLAWLNALESLGYRYEWRVLNAANYGDPQTRERFFLLAAKNGSPPPFPEPTHSENGGRTLFGVTKKWKAVEEIIEWDVRGKSIFRRKRPLVPNTLRRVLHGLRRFGGVTFVLPNEGVHRGNAPRSTDKPLNTVTAGRGAGSFVQPFISTLVGTSESCLKHNHRSAKRPAPTVTGAGNLALTTPFIVSFKGTSEGALKRSHRSTKSPSPTITGTNSVAMCDPYVMQFYGGKKGSKRTMPITRPAPTVVGSPTTALVDPFVLNMRGGSDGYTRASSKRKPAPTITGAPPTAWVEPFVIAVNHGKDKRAYSRHRPLHTVTSVDATAWVSCHIRKNGKDKRATAVLDSEDLAWQMIEEIVLREASKKNNDYAGIPVLLPDGSLGVLDILMRMFTPRELARAQSFPDSYHFAGSARDDIVKQIGNAWAGETSKALSGVVLDRYL
jgi:DNA (cytosine-5)-methyltransferase 1